jgi:imidazolonepropionase
MRRKLLGPFSEIVTMEHLPLRGAIEDRRMEILRDGAVLMEGERIVRVLQSAEFDAIRRGQGHAGPVPEIVELEEETVLFPGLVDAHTHMCFAGSRSEEYARRLSGESYLDIARQGGGIMSTVHSTRAASEDELVSSLSSRAAQHLADGVTTCEVKSGYGLDPKEEVKMLHAIGRVNALDVPRPQLVPTCLAAHVLPPEFHDPQAYLGVVLRDLLPLVWREGLAGRVDIYVDKGAFSPELALPFLNGAKALGFAITVHADQFSLGGSKLAAQVGAVSADHLERSGDEELDLLHAAGVIATVLPGSSLGLGLPFARAREMLDQGLCLVIASDWNPGSAPMGDLLTQAALLGAQQRLSMAETWAGITFRAAQALGLEDRGRISEGARADLVGFPCSGHKEVLYRQGALRPNLVVCGGRCSWPSQRGEEVD